MTTPDVSARGRRLLTMAAVLVTATLSTGCFLRVNGKPLSFGESSAPSHEVDDSDSDDDDDSGSVEVNSSADSGVIKLYTKASYKNFTPKALNERRQNTILPGWVFPDWGTKVSALRDGNPDPKRFPGWEKHSLRDRAFAVIYAVIERTWTRACHKEFNRYWKAWDELDDKYRPRMKKARKKSFYKGSLALREVLDDLEKEAAEKGLNLPKKHPSRWGGLRYEVLEALYAMHEGKPVMNSVRADGYRQHGHPRGKKARERDQYCAYAALYGGLELVQKPSSKEPKADLLVPHRWRKKRERTKERLQASAKVAKQKLTFKGVNASRISLQHTSPKKGKLVHVGGASHGGTARYEVTKVSRSGKQTRLTMKYTKHSERRTNCRRTNRVYRIHPDGRVEYEEICTFTPYKIVWTVDATLDDVPKGWIRRGDNVSLFGKIRRANVDRGNGKKVYNNRFTIDGVQLEHVTRKDERIY